MGLTVLFAAAWCGQAAVQWYAYAAREAVHGRPAEAGGFLLEFWAATLAGWQAILLLLVLVAAIGPFLIRRTEARLDAMMAQLDRLEHG